jgi:DHA1 family multidrug resistance protein-like MFS transporter
MVIVLQYQLTRWVEGKWPPLVLWAFGSALSGVAFLALIPFPGMAGLLTCVILLTLGGMLLRPVDYQMVVGMGPQDSVASYYGFSAISVALGGSAGQYLGGRLIDVADATGQASLPWLVFAAFGLGAALLMRWFDRSVHPVPTA